MTRTMSAQDAMHLQVGGEELALLDVREIVPYGKGHALLAANLPLSRLEIEVGQRVPRLDTRVVLMDADGSVAKRASGHLQRMGYTDVSVVAGGVEAWARTGYRLFPEVDVPSKGFGAFAREHGNPRYIKPADLQRARLSAPEHWVILDARSVSEYRRACIPGSIAAPAGQALRCVDDFVSDSEVNVVVTCMSATRGVLGGLSLIAAGVPNPVHVLLHGTHGWTLSGQDLEIEAARIAHAPSDLTQRTAITRTSRLLARAGVARIDMHTLDEWLADRSRTTYLFDVRSAAEYEAGHVPGSVNTPEGALVMSLQRYAATLNARVVLIDDDGVRAGVAAVWLKQMGLVDPVILTNGLVTAPLVTGAADIARPAGVHYMGAVELDRLRDTGAARVLDVGDSWDYERAHIPGARWCSRAEINRYLNTTTFADRTVLTSSDGVAAAHAGTGLPGNVCVLDGGNQAWARSGRQLTDERPEYLAPRDDRFLGSFERPGDTRRNVIAYLGWEDQLLDQVESSGEMPYRNLLW